MGQHASQLLKFLHLALQFLGLKSLDEMLEKMPQHRDDGGITSVCIHAEQVMCLYSP